MPNQVTAIRQGFPFTRIGKDIRHALNVEVLEIAAGSTAVTLPAAANTMAASNAAAEAPHLDRDAVRARIRKKVVKRSLSPAYPNRKPPPPSAAK